MWIYLIFENCFFISQKYFLKRLQKDRLQKDFEKGLKRGGNKKSESEKDINEK